MARHPEIREIDINPLLADDKGVIALDARVRVADAAAEPARADGDPALSVGVGDGSADRCRSAPSRIRPIRPEDEALYARLLRPRDAGGPAACASSPPRRDLSHRFLAPLTQIDYAREMAFVAIARQTGALLGVVRVVADPDYTRGEYAILVRSDLKGRGLGWRLMQHLIAYARAEKLQELHGSVLADNTTMLQMCRELGFAVEREPGDAGVRRVVLPLTRAGPYDRAAASEPRLRRTWHRRRSCGIDLDATIGGSAVRRG